MRVTFFNATLPVDTSGRVLDPVAAGLNDLDGFSPLQPIMTYFPNVAIAPLDVPRLWNIGISTAAACPTVLLDTVTGERVAHWVETDHSSGDVAGGADYERALLLWPAHRLSGGRRYIVAMRGLTNTSGAPIVASPAFAALRDGTPSTDPDVEERRALFKDIFGHLAAAGVDSLVAARVGLHDRH